MKAFERVVNNLEKTLLTVTRRVSNIGEVVLLAMVLLIIVDIILRRIFNNPISWSLEVIRVELVVVVFFSVAYCGARRGHISIDVLTSRLPPRIQAYLETVMIFLGMGLFIFMAWGSINSGMGLLANHRITGLLPIPLYPFAFAVALGSLLLALVLMVQLLHSIKNMVSK